MQHVAACVISHYCKESYGQRKVLFDGVWSFMAAVINTAIPGLILRTEALHYDASGVYLSFPFLLMNARREGRNEGRKEGRIEAMQHRGRKAWGEGCVTQGDGASRPTKLLPSASTSSSVRQYCPGVPECMHCHMSFHRLSEHTPTSSTPQCRLPLALSQTWRDFPCKHGLRARSVVQQ